jgi:hypothetical protein
LAFDLAEPWAKLSDQLHHWRARWRALLLGLTLDESRHRQQLRNLPTQDRARQLVTREECSSVERGKQIIRRRTSSPEVKVLLLTHIASVPAFQSAEDDGGQNSKSAEHKKCLMKAVNHLSWI